MSPQITNLPNLVLIDGEKGDGTCEISSPNLKKLSSFMGYMQKIINNNYKI